jgi:hypothetical protein
MALRLVAITAPSSADMPPLKALIDSPPPASDNHKEGVARPELTRPEK